MNLELIPRSPNEVIEIPIKDGELRLYPYLFSPQECQSYLTQLIENIDWQQDEIKLYGKQIPLPRLTAWFGDEGKNYMYSGITVKPKTWTPCLLDIKNKVEKISNVRFNSVLLNYYRNERDSVSWHSDDEPELGKDPIIGSVSFGDVRTFQLKHKTDKVLSVNKDLPDGSYLEMAGSTQHYWLHQIPKRTRKIGPRINLTFRIIRGI